MQHWAADREVVLEAKLVGMKAELKLAPDQEKLWTPFETAVLDSAKARMDAMQKMVETRENREHMSPVDHLEATADHLSQTAARVKKIADAAKPLYDSLDENQKHSFGALGRMLMPERERFAEQLWRHQERRGMRD
jgi:LTXXQ motif family protein